MLFYTLTPPIRRFAHRSVKKTCLGFIGGLLIFFANILIPSSPVATIVLQSLNILSYIRLEWNYGLKALREMDGRWREGGGAGDAAEQATGSTDIEVELRQNPLYIDDKDERKSSKGEKSERDGLKSDKDKKIMEGLVQYMNPGAKNSNAKKANQKKQNTTKAPLKKEGGE